MKNYYLILLAFGISGSIRAQSNDVIYWSSDYNLVLQDFQGIVDDVNFADYDAVTMSGPKVLAHMIGDEYYVDSVRNLFYKKNSWVREFVYSNPTDSLQAVLKTDDLLIHENLHFDISEIFVRKLRWYYDSLDSLNIRNRQFYDHVRTLVTEQRERFDQEFDKETEYGKFFLKQLEWEKNINEELKKYEIFLPHPSWRE